MSLLADKVAVVTGAGRGIGRAVALAYARMGADVACVSRTEENSAKAAVEVEALGRRAWAVAVDVSDTAAVDAAAGKILDDAGRVDILVNNAGVTRDNLLMRMSEEEWDSVTRVHLKGHFAPARHAIAYWRDLAKAGVEVDGRVVMTSSGAGLMGSIGQGNYAAAKAGIALLVVQAAAEWGRYGVLVNGVAPDARTRMTEGVFYGAEAPDGWDDKDPANVSPLMVWLGSADCDVTGRVFEATGGSLNVCDGWQHGPVVSVAGRRFEVAEVGEAVHRSIRDAPDPAPVFGSGG